MYVRPEVRGRGVGRTLLAAIEELARDLGYALARLDTGAEMLAVRRMYERAGYAPVPDYNGNPYAGWWGEKPLVGGDDRTPGRGDDRTPGGGPDPRAAP